MRKNELVGYALDFVSYLISQTEGIDRVVLFGSVARGDFNEESDVDLFIDTKNKKLAAYVEKITDSFHQTEKAKMWALKGITNTVSCVVGNLDDAEWRDLKRSMATDGVILYGKYTTPLKKTLQYILFVFEGIKPESKRVSAHRTLFGFRSKKKSHGGLADVYHVTRLGKGSILVPIEHAQKIKDFFRKRKITVRVYDIWSDSVFIPYNKII